MEIHVKQALELITDFAEMGLDYDRAVLASIKVTEARYSEAIVHNIESSRINHLDRLLDQLHKLQEYDNTGRER